MENVFLDIYKYKQYNVEKYKSLGDKYELQRYFR